jgi:hypothetical protein
MILRGEKTQTRRPINPRYSYKVGRIYGIRSHWFQKSVAHILITGKRIERLGGVTLEDAEKEGGYTVEEYKREWKDIHGEWNPDLQVYVYDFDLVNRTYVQLGTSEGKSQSKSGFLQNR